jgi:hypothetical protein
MISRRDIEAKHQAIQATHAALNLAYSTGPPDSHPALVHLTVESQEELSSLMQKLQQLGVQIASFHEPYKDWGLTALAAYLKPEQSKILSQLPLWTL